MTSYWGAGDERLPGLPPLDRRTDRPSSVLSLVEGWVAGEISSMLRTAGIEAQGLELEVTESGIMGDQVEAAYAVRPAISGTGTSKTPLV